MRKNLDEILYRVHQSPLEPAELMIAYFITLSVRVHRTQPGPPSKADVVVFKHSSDRFSKTCFMSFRGYMYVLLFFIAQRINLSHSWSIRALFHFDFQSINQSFFFYFFFVN